MHRNTQHNQANSLKSANAQRFLGLAPDQLQQNFGATPLQSDYANWLGKWLLGAGAMGAALRGTTGLGELMSLNAKRPPEAPEPIVLNVPYRVKPKEQTNPNAVIKSAEGPIQKMLNTTFFKGLPGASSYWDIPAAYPLTFLGGLGAAYGGYRAMDSVVERRKKKLQDDDLEDARKEYEHSLLQQFKPIPQTKVRTRPLNEASMSKFGNDGSSLTQSNVKALLEKTAQPNSKLARIADKLDQLAEKAVNETTEKNAYNFSDFLPWNWKMQAGNPAGDVTSRGLGGYGVIAPLLALASGTAMYQYAKSNNPDAIVADALRKQHQERWSKRPPEVYARLVPVNEKGLPAPSTKGIPPNEQENNTPPTFKTGSTKLSMDEINQKATEFVNELLGVG